MCIHSGCVLGMLFSTVLAHCGVLPLQRAYLFVRLQLCGGFKGKKLSYKFKFRVLEQVLLQLLLRLMGQGAVGWGFSSMRKFPWFLFSADHWSQSCNKGQAVTLHSHASCVIVW